MIDSDTEDRCSQDSSHTGTEGGNSAQARGETGEKALLPPPLFKHRDLTKIPKSAPRIEKRKLTNIINHLNFTDGYLWVHLRDPRYEEDIFVHAYPQPCTGETITCRWSQENVTGFEYHRFLNLVIDDGMAVTLIPVKLLHINREGFTIQMPDAGHVLGKREARRYACQGVTAELTQSGFLARGTLLDFSSLSFRVRVAPALEGSFHWLNPDEPATLTLYQGQKIVFSDPCRFIDQTSSMSVKEIVLAPVKTQFHRFRGREIRSPRVNLAPSSSVTFVHPFVGKNMQRDIIDISVSGLSVLENMDECVLIPGMIIHHLTIRYSGALKLSCTAQVVYRRKEKKGGFRCGLAILDMDASTYGKLSNILGNVLDPHLHISDEIDTDALWKFFFETDFINSKKYALLESHKDKFKELYRNLYRNSPELSTHVTYQRNGNIYGHVSMMRAYHRTWMVHHLAAKPMPGNTSHTGLKVLHQLLNYFDGFTHLPSAKMDYAMFYFRPENRFPNFFFGGFVRDMHNPEICSLDLFAYKNYGVKSSQNPLPDTWSLKEFSAADSYSLEQFYRNHSKGLLLRALDMGPKPSGDSELKEVYKKHGFKRQWKMFSLTHAQELKAVLIVDQSDIGLNLSELLNGIKIIVTDPHGLPWDTLTSAIDQLTGVYQVDSIPLLVYPHTYLEESNVAYEKQYYTWIIDIQYAAKFLDYMKKKTTIKLRYALKFLIKRLLKK
jgi:hypothetical protein